jgi:hypothetical protein
MLLKRGLLGFWALWFTLVTLTNLVDALNSWGVFDPKWRWASGNWRLLEDTTARFMLPIWTNQFLYLGVISWQALAAFLFWYAMLALRRQGPPPVRVVAPAFTVSLLLWAAFMIADEFFLAYAVEGKHLMIFTAQLATLLTIHLLPERPEREPTAQ